MLPLLRDCWRHIVRNLKVFRYSLCLFGLEKLSFMAGIELSELPKASFFKLSEAVAFCLHGGLSNRLKACCT